MTIGLTPICARHLLYLVNHVTPTHPELLSLWGFQSCVNGLGLVALRYSMACLLSNACSVSHQRVAASLGLSIQY